MSLASQVNALATRVANEFNSVRTAIAGVAAVPTGTVFNFAGTAAPAGYLLCDGSGFSATQYPSLAAIVGDLYAPHSGDTYYLPNFGERSAVGPWWPNNDMDTVGKTGGEVAHVLAVNEIPTHNHGAGSGEHGHGTRSSGATGGSTLAFLRSANTSVLTGGGMVDSTTGGHTHDNVGGGQAHNNMPPYVVMHYVIKT